MPKVLAACEKTQAVTIEFRKLGIETYSCDIEPCSGGHPEWHLQRDVREILDDKWDLVIAFPPCTHLATSGARWFPEKIKDGRQQEGIDFFMLFVNAKCHRVAIENPIGIMSTKYRKPDQIVHPYHFGDEATKSTCLWLKNLPLLVPTKVVSKGEFVTYDNGKKQPKWYANLSATNRSSRRSSFFKGMAEAMAHQWSKVLK